MYNVYTQNLCRPPADISFFSWKGKGLDISYIEMVVEWCVCICRFKAAFETNNNTITTKSLSPSPNTQRKVNLPNQHTNIQSDIKPVPVGTVSNNPFTKMASGRISPIKISPSQEKKTEKPPPAFISIFQPPNANQNASSSTSSNKKPRKLEIKTATPYVNPAAAGGTGSKTTSSSDVVDSTIRWEPLLQKQCVHYCLLSAVCVTASAISASVECHSSISCLMHVNSKEISSLTSWS